MSQFKKNVVLFKDVAASTTSKTQCNSAQFSATTDGGTAPVICGTNTGYHSKTILRLLYFNLAYKPVLLRTEIQKKVSSLNHMIARVVSCVVCITLFVYMAL